MKTITTAYSSDTDMTFILLEETNKNGEPISTECVGWYYGSPNEDDTQRFFGKLKAEY